MGKCTEFICPVCGYTATVSGGDDCGMLTQTTTIACADCRKLRDITIATLSEDGSRQWQQRPLRCPRSHQHRITRWNFPGTCPRCAAPMRIKPDGTTTLWD